MVSEMMLEDVEDLARRGINLTPREIVRLNALGLAAERGPHAASIFSLPRAVIMGDILFREPTIGHEIWLDEVARVYDMEDGMTSFAVTCLCYATPRAEDLPRWADKREMLDALTEFVERRLAAHTMREVLAAVRYVRDGANPEDGEDGPKRETKEDREIEADELSNWSSSIGAVHEGQSIGLGIPLADATRMTRQALRAVIARAYEVKGLGLAKGERETAIGDYNLTLDQIVAEHERTASNG